jgi:hypothetical protein
LDADRKNLLERKAEGRAKVVGEIKGKHDAETVEE